MHKPTTINWPPTTIHPTHACGSPPATKAWTTRNTVPTVLSGTPMTGTPTPPNPR